MIIKCKMCGGDLHPEIESTTCECEFCGTVQTIPTDDGEKKANLFNRANHLRMNAEFDKAAVVYENVSATATFPFDLGTEGQTANFGDAADFFLNSKVIYGEGLQLKDANSGAGIVETRFEPYSQNNSADASNLIQFTIQPKFGLTFTPTKVSFKATRFGTDNGLLDVAWLNADGSTVTLATEVKPNRNSGTNPHTQDLPFRVQRPVYFRHPGQ